VVVEVAWPWCKLVVYKASALASASASASAFALVVALATELVAETCSSLGCSLEVHMLVSKVQGSAMGGHFVGLLELQHHPVVLGIV